MTVEKRVEIEFAVVDKFTREMNNITNSLKKFGTAGVLGIDQVMPRLQERFTNINGIIDDLTKRTTKFEFGWLSVMFAAQMVNRTMTNLFKDMVTTFKEVANKQHPLNLALTRMNAAFTYLKFSIIEAMSPTLERFASWFSDLAIRIADMDPATLKQIGDSLLLILGLGGFFYATSQFALLVQGLASIIANGPGIISSLTTITSKLTGLSGLLAAGFSFWLIFEGIRDAAGGDFTTALDNLIALGLTWFAGLGWGVGFYLVNLGIKSLTGKGLTEHVQSFIEDLQSRLKIRSEYFPDTPLFEIYSESFTKQYEALTKTAIPATDEFTESIKKNTEAIPSMVSEINNAKTAIDQIPDHTVKTVEIRTIRTGLRSETGGEDESVGSSGLVQTRTPFR